MNFTAPHAEFAANSNAPHAAFPPYSNAPRPFEPTLRTHAATRAVKSNGVAFACRNSASSLPLHRQKQPGTDSRLNQTSAMNPHSQARWRGPHVQGHLPGWGTPWLAGARVVALDMQPPVRAVSLERPHRPVALPAAPALLAGERSGGQAPRADRLVGLACRSCWPGAQSTGRGGIVRQQQSP